MKKWFERYGLVVLLVATLIWTFAMLPIIINWNNEKGYNAADAATTEDIDILEQGSCEVITDIVKATTEKETEECVTEEKLIFAGPTKKPLVAIEEEEKGRIALERQRLLLEEQSRDISEETPPQPVVQEYIPEQPVEPIATDTDASEEPGVYLGCYITTAYHWTGNPCSDGVYPILGYTVACNDPALWHRWVYIDGVGARYVHDRGGMSTYTHLDIYVGDYDSCIAWGRRDLNVWLME